MADLISLIQQLSRRHNGGDLDSRRSPGRMCCVCDSQPRHWAADGAEQVLHKNNAVVKQLPLCLECKDYHQLLRLYLLHAFLSSLNFSTWVHRQLLISKRAVRNHFLSTHSSAAASCPPSFSNPPCPSSSSQQHQQHDINLPAAATAGPLSHTFLPHNPLDQLFKNPSPSAAMFIMGVPSLRRKNNNSDEGSGGGQWQRPGQAAGPKLPHRQPCLLPHWRCLYLTLINHFCC
ncbi:hypothetical protein PtA15_6A433 [Puccinia triticina]|uniref:Uncharacterized protein n=1 Tax=Puccinia triticina TaxID=208348 RepID=A0ABY7CKY5_9BASI|nr:uncharacterized protein PtA15_6A433 [Puccinia triticina]WAQ85804.1 hypothetical protein PtA15_6A433 [Puccinia triticina]